ncbi:MAG TPA: hypothetical protein VGW75_12365 [Solirubrobacteraceae bacterium]|nr:hypothetical protein [Solirubrobacteraceae bacterium]
MRPNQPGPRAGQCARAAVAAVLACLVAAPVAAAALPDGRAYELVSPPEKNGYDVDATRTAFTPAATVLMAAWGDFGESAGSAVNTYHARRTAGGWDTDSVTPGKENGPAVLWGANDPIVDVAPDGVTSVLQHTQSFDFPDHDDFAPDLFRYRLDTLAVEWLSGGTSGENAGNTPTYAGASSDFSHVVFSTYAEHEPEHASGNEAVYEYVDGELRVVNVDDSLGVPAPGVPGGGDTFPEAAGVGSSRLPYKEGSAHNAVSDDGSRIYFTRAEGTDVAGGIRGILHLRENGSDTIHVADNATYLTASTDGGKAFFTSTEQLVAADTDTAADVYEYDVEADAYRLVAQDEGVFARLTDDGQNGIVVTAKLDNTGTSVVRTLHAVRAGTVTKIADVPSGFPEVSVFLNAVYGTCAALQVTPDGRHAAFATADPLEAGDTDGAVDVYRYDADDNSLTRVSPGNEATPAAVNAWCDGTVALERRFISDDGRLVAFQTAEALVAEDTNGRVDVYRYDAGTGAVALISAGTGARDSRFVALSRDGQDVLFATRDRLVTQDVDDIVDVYTARVGGGFPPVEPPARLCSEDECQGTAPGVPPAGRTASETTTGAGNLTPDPDPPAAVRIVLRRIGEAAKRRAARTGRLRIAVTATGAGRLTAALRARGVTAARAARTLTGAGTVRLTLRLSRTVRRALARRGRLRATVVVRHSAVARPATRDLTLRRPSDRRGGGR